MSSTAHKPIDFPCLRAKVLLAPDDARAKIDTRTPLAWWSLVDIAHRGSGELGHHDPKGVGEGEVEQRVANPNKLRQCNLIMQLPVSCPRIHYNYVTYNLQTHLPA